MQMDIKIDGLTCEIIEEALEQARRGRLEIMNHMLQTIDQPRTELSAYAPKVVTMTIKKPDKIRDVIGPGGKKINEIIDETALNSILNKMVLSYGANMINCYDKSCS